jgi:hypothetical protein
MCYILAKDQAYDVKDVDGNMLRFEHFCLYALLLVYGGIIRF